MGNSITINSGTVLPTDAVRFIKPIDEEERARLITRYGDDAGNFNIALQFADKTTKLATQTLDEIREQGVALVNIGSERHVVADNIRQASPFTRADAEKLSGEQGYTLNQKFRSRVDTTAGTLLSLATPAQIMDRRAKALGRSGGPQAANG